ncbi:MAG: hypothetical protein P1V33_08200 [Pseudohongiella nitratireducens]|nr:hypothetical protein [Pseudohongiella nitratireducens]MDF1623434.1 hypothetical protein [Pseudohongiella nitratireducens]
MRDSPEMRFMRGMGRGWIEVNNTRDEIATQFFYVSTVLEPVESNMSIIISNIDIYS